MPVPGSFRFYDYPGTGLPDTNIRWEACPQTGNLIEFTVRSAKNIERNCRMKISNGTTDPRHRRRNIRPPATTDQALRAARPKGRPRA